MSLASWKQVFKCAVSIDYSDEADLVTSMGRVVGKFSCDYMVLDLSSRQLDDVASSKQAFLEIDPNQGRNTDDVEATPAELKKYMNTDRVPVKVMPCRCRSRCALKRLRKKHGNYVDCTIYYM